MFTREIATYEELRQAYDRLIAERMGVDDYRAYNEVLFSAHSCAIEGNSFSVDDTRELRDKGLGMIPRGKSLLEAFEILDHFAAFEYVVSQLDKPLDEALLKEVNRLVTLHTIGYKTLGEGRPGEYTTRDMAAGDTLFGDHEELIARVPKLIESTNEAMAKGIHPMVVAARFHGYFEYLHPFRDGNGRTGRLLSNFLLMREGHPMVIITNEQKADYIAALRMIRKERTDEYLVSFFFEAASARMRAEMAQKRGNSLRTRSFLF